MNTSLFRLDEFFVDQKVLFIKLSNEYKIFDNRGKQVGAVMQKLSGWGKVAKLMLNKAMLPFQLDIQDVAGNVLVSIKRGWTFWLSKIEITDNRGMALGQIRQKFAFMKPKFEIYDPSQTLIAEITGDWIGWNFVINDVNSKQIGAINKKWAGAAREIFTTADKYHVTIVPEYKEDNTKIAILSAAITIDMILKENNNH
jgi:uncharacterized protein YxjI